MITRITLQGFKAFSQPAIIDMKDIIVLAGANSCGKTSLIQALLLLSQTLEARRADVALDLGGRFVQFAELRDIIFGRPKRAEAEFSVSFDVSVGDIDFLKALGQHFDLAARTLNLRRTRKELPQTTYNYHIEITFAAHVDGVPFVKKATLSKSVGNDLLVRHTLERRRTLYGAQIEVPAINAENAVLAQSVLTEVAKLAEIAQSSTDLGPTRTRGLASVFGQMLASYSLNWDDIPEIGDECERILRTIRGLGQSDLVAEQAAKVAETLVKYIRERGATREMVLPLPFDHFLPLAGSYPASAAAFDQQSVYQYMELLTPAFEMPLLEIRRFLRLIQYVGPLRARPERAYLSTGTPLDIGNAGENAVPVLWQEQTMTVRSKTKTGQPITEKPLGEAVLDWFEEFGIASSLQVTKPKRVIYQVEMDSSPGSNTTVTIADVGFGVSQLLPVIVAGLRSPEGATLIFEQPEIHLHPRIQAKLADFFLCLVELGKRVIVETHSEHLINSLRLRAAQDSTSSLHSHMSILFVHPGRPTSPDSTGPGSSVEPLHVDQYGSIDNWPPDFFPESSQMNEDLLKAMMEKHSRGRS